MSIDEIRSMNPHSDLPSGQEMHINLLDRDEIVALLTSVCIQCYDTESTEELRIAVRANVADGTIELK